VNNPNIKKGKLQKDSKSIDVDVLDVAVADPAFREALVKKFENYIVYNKEKKNMLSNI
jgi:hypothetical protein